MPLTDLQIRNLKPSDKPYKVFDGRGLYIEVAPTGGKWWRYKYYWLSKEKRISLGVYPDVTLAAARERHREARKQLANGLDPSAERRKKKLLSLEKAGSSFDAVAREWHEKQKDRWTLEHADRVIQSLERDVFPRIGRMRITEIQAPVLLSVLRRIEDRGALDVASRILQRTSAVFRYAIQTGRATYNPCQDLRGAIKTRKVTHRAAMDRAELPRFLERLEAYDGHPLTRMALSLTVLTFVRTQELRGARWPEFDIDARLWRIPAARMKMARPHLVPLSDQVMALIDELRPFAGRGGMLFPGPNSPAKPMSANTMLYALYRLGYHGRATVHGFRATASTILNESGFHSDAIERQLAHVEKNKVRAAYHRSEYLDERRRMMQWWADYLDGIRQGASVTPIKTSRKA